MSLSVLSDPVVVETVANETTHHAAAAHDVGHEMLFGTVFQENIHIGTYTSMLAVIIASVIAVDILFHGLVILTDDTPFSKMIHAIEKELMTVGFTAFIFKIIINSSTLINGDYLYALEFADTLVPVYSFCNCFLGLFLVFLSMKQSDLWSQAFHMKLDELLDDYFEKSSSRWHKMLPTAFSRLTSQLEFRIFHNIFCEMFNIHTAAIAFDEYVNCVAEKYVFSIIKISPVSWCVFGLIAVFDYARLDYTKFFFECHEHDHHCKQMNTTYLFAIVGAMLLFVVLVFAFVSRYYQIQMIRMKGISSVKMYPAFLQYFEDLQDRTDNQRMKEDDLQKAVNDAKAKRSSNINKRSRHLLSTQASFTIFGVSNSRKNVAKVSPDDVFNNFKNNLQAVAAAGSSDKQSGKFPKMQKKKRAPSLEEDPPTTGEGEGEMQQRAELVSLAAQDKTPNITRMSIQELMHLETLQAANDKEIDDLLREMKKERDSVKSTHSKHGPGLRNSISLGLKNLRNSILLMAGGVVPEEMVEGQGAQPDLEAGESNNGVPDDGISAKTSDFPASSKNNNDNAEEGEEQQSKDTAEGTVSTATVVGGATSMKMKLVSFDATVPEDMQTFKQKLSASFMFNKPQPSPIQLAITEAMNAAGIAHVATKLDDGTYELSVVHNGKGTDEDGAAFQPEFPVIDRIAEGSESIHSASIPVTKENENLPAELTPSDPKNSEQSSRASSRSRPRGNVFKVFLFEWPELYFQGSQALIIFLSMYIAIWLIYFMPSAVPGGWKVLTLLPGVLSFMTFTYIVKVACFLKAIFQIDNEAMLEVVEQTESSKILKKTIIDKLMTKLRSMGDEQAQIFQLFREIDQDDDNALSRQELAHYLNSLDVFFSRKKWNQVFRDICIYRNNKISFDEFSLFLFPNHGVVLAQEKKRLNKLKHRVSLKSIELVKKVNLSGKNHGL